jgi:ATP-dependent DNA helicase RecQ
MSPQQARESVGGRDTRQRQVLFGLLGGYDVSESADAELDVADFAEAIGLDAGAVRRALSTLTASNIISYTPARRTRGVLMCDERPVSQLRIRPQEIARRAALEQRKLREVISFCYTDRCYRAFILDYFGDRHHAASCGTCGNCRAPQSKSASAAGGATEIMSPPMEEVSPLDRFITKHTPTAFDLDEELGEQTRLRRAREKAESAFESEAQEISITEARPLTDEEKLLVRKILACAARMQGRFGKGMLAATLRGSRAKNVIQAGLNQLSTYGILDDMTQDELMIYIDALVAAGCMTVTGGAYPTVSLSAFGNDVMRERAEVELALQATPLSNLSVASAAPMTSAASHAAQPATARKQVSTVDETYALYCEGLSIEEISRQRGLTMITVEKHLADCIMQGRAVDVSEHVSDADRALIEVAVDQLGTQLLKPLRDALPSHINYRMIRFVVADLQHAEQSSEEESA